MTIRLPDSLANSNYKFDVNIPKPVFNTVHHGDGSISLSLCYNASEIEEFARNAARSMYENIENSIIKELLELNGYEEVVRCEECEHCRSVREGCLKFCTFHGHIAEPDDYCSWAERKKDEN